MDNILINKKGEILESIQGAFLRGYIPSGVKVNQQEEFVECDFPSISLAVWRQCVGFNRWVVDKYNAEAMLSLFVSKDRTTLIPAVFHQQLKAGLSVELDYETPENEKLMESYRQLITSPSLFWGTIHNHVEAVAFQSGTDVADEENLLGPHITIGEMDKERLSLHARVNGRFPVGGRIHQKFYDISTRALVDPDDLQAELGEYSEYFAESAVENALDRIVDLNGEFDFPPEWKERVKKPVVVERSAWAYGQGYGSHSSTTIKPLTGVATFKEALIDLDAALDLLRTEHGDDVNLGVESGYCSYLSTLPSEAGKAFLESMVLRAITDYEPPVTSKAPRDVESIIKAWYWSADAHWWRDIQASWGLLPPRLLGNGDRRCYHLASELARLGFLVLGDTRTQGLPLLEFYISLKNMGFFEEFSQSGHPYEELDSLQFFARDLERILLEAGEDVDTLVGWLEERERERARNTKQLPPPLPEPKPKIVKAEFAEWSDYVEELEGDENLASYFKPDGDY